MIRIVNVVKLLCSVSRLDDATSVLLFEHLLNGSLYEWLDARAVAENVQMIATWLTMESAYTPPTWCATVDEIRPAVYRGVCPR